MRHFKGSLLVLILGLSIALLYGGWNALFLTLLLATLEISLSFENAVLNSTVLHKMTPKWQRRFVTWGILVSVFLVRFILPLIIVVLITHLNLIEVVKLAITNPQEYAKHILNAKSSISAFGGMFLLMVFLAFLFDHQKTIHWFVNIEKKLGQMGKSESIKIILALLVLLILQSFVPEEQKVAIILAGSIGIILFILLNSLTAFLNQARRETKSNSGLMQFLYLEILDASFSLDGVVSAFAITRNIIIIFLGLVIGAIFVRSLTISLVEKQVLKKYLFLEHGAHYAIGTLSFVMLASIFFHIPEILTAFIGVGFIGLSLFTSIKRHPLKKS